MSLSVDEHGTAHGGIVGDSAFMWLREQRIRRGPVRRAARDGVFWLLDFESRSWAKLTHATPDASEDEFPVYQYGPRRLWDEVTARQWWIAQGSPDAERWRFTITPHGQRIELR